MSMYEWFGIIAALVSFSAYPTFIIEFVGGRTKEWRITGWMWTKLGLKGGIQPHPMTWALWVPLQLLILKTSFDLKAWATLFMPAAFLLGCLSVAWFAWRYGDRKIDRVDIICAAITVVSAILEFRFKEPAWSLLFAIVADFSAMWPTIVIATKNPASESRLGWTIFTLGALINLLAVDQWTFGKAGFTVYVVVACGYMAAITWLHHFKQQRRTTAEVLPAQKEGS